MRGGPDGGPNDGFEGFECATGWTEIEAELTGLETGSTEGLVVAFLSFEALLAMEGGGTGVSDA